MVSAGEGRTSSSLPSPPRALFVPARAPSWLEHGNHEASAARGSLRDPAVRRSGGGAIAVPLASLEEAQDPASGARCGSGLAPRHACRGSWQLKTLVEEIKKW